MKNDKQIKFAVRAVVRRADETRRASREPNSRGLVSRVHGNVYAVPAKGRWSLYA